MTIKFIAYSDIHHDKLGARVIRLQDTLSIEHQIFQRAFEGGFDFTLFCGDRFLRREPEDEVKTKSDQLLKENLHYASVERPGFQHYVLVGNHDWVHNSMKWHTYESSKDVENMWVFDGTYFTVAHQEYCIHGLPAGFNFDMSKYQVDPSKFNIFMFHDVVKGAYSDESGNHTFPDGLSITNIDRSEFNLVLAGDVHVPQKLGFKNTTGGYIGSVLQRTRVDANRQRGWLEVIVDRVGSTWDINTTFVPVREFFTKVVIDVSSGMSFNNINLPDSTVDDTSVEVVLRGAREDVDRIADDPKWDNYKLFGNARDIDTIRGYEVEQSEVVVDMSQSTSLVDDLEAYLDSGFVDIGNLDREKLVEEVQL